MRSVRSALTLAGVLGVAGCVQPGPPQPTVSAMPGQGRDYASFQSDDGYCRQTAAQAVNGVDPGAAAANNGIASAAIGTGIGAAAGALLGAASGHAGAGAAIGAGTGLLFGSAAGANNAAYTGNSIQHRINVVYAQCMQGHGDQVQGMYRGPYGGQAAYQGGGYGGPPPGGPGPYEGGQGYGGPGQAGPGPYEGGPGYGGPGPNAPPPGY